MSYEAIQDVLSRAFADEAFRRRLYSEPEAALSDFDLTADERAALRAIGAEEKEPAAELLDRRLSKRPAWLFWL
jgi:hypothetical protein